jgi:hypothetical protein
MQSQPVVGMIAPSPGAVSAANCTPSLPSLLLLCSEYRVSEAPSHVPSPLNHVPEPVQNASPELPMQTTSTLPAHQLGARPQLPQAQLPQCTQAPTGSSTTHTYLPLATPADAASSLEVITRIATYCPLTASTRPSSALAACARCDATSTPPCGSAVTADTTRSPRPVL